MLQLLGSYNIKFNGKVVDTFTMVSKGVNHCQIVNNRAVLFDGYILQGYKVWEEYIQKEKVFMDFAKQFGYELEITK